ncbi:uncharacterized protein SPAPADRAFT_59751, partial [Spathaspora passalidarum NRRL Y-27907]
MSEETAPGDTTTTTNDSIEVVLQTNLNRFTSFVRELSGTTSQENTPDNTEPSPLVVLGEQYTSLEDAEHSISNKLWLSYRCGFDPITKAPDGPTPISFFPSLVFNKRLFTTVRSLFDSENFNSDVGWGCMIRTSQSLLANALMKLQPSAEHEVINLFQDNIASAFSLHNFIRVASESPLEVKPGQWFGPNAASLSTKKLLDGMKGKTIQGVKYPHVFISENSDLYDEEIEELLVESSVLILFPVRLGIDNVNSYYYDSIFQLLACPFTVGISGGKPSSSFYFLGYQDQDLLYFDPHSPQLYENPINYTTYHTNNYQRLHIHMLDPSMMVGILVKDKSEYKEFKRCCTENANKIVHFHPQQSPV